MVHRRWRLLPFDHAQRALDLLRLTPFAVTVAAVTRIAEAFNLDREALAMRPHTRRVALRDVLRHLYACVRPP